MPNNQFNGTVDIYNSASRRTISLDGDKGLVSVGGGDVQIGPVGGQGGTLGPPLGRSGLLTVNDNAGRPMAQITGGSYGTGIGSVFAAGGTFTLFNGAGEVRLFMDATASGASLRIGGNGANGNLYLVPAGSGHETVNISAWNAHIIAGGEGTNGELGLFKADAKDRTDTHNATIDLRAWDASIRAGGAGVNGSIYVLDQNGTQVLKVDGNGNISAKGDISANGNLVHQRITQRSRKVSANESHGLFSVSQDGAFIVELIATANDTNTTPVIGYTAYLKWIVSTHKGAQNALDIIGPERLSTEAEKLWKYPGPQFSISGGNVTIILGDFELPSSSFEFRDATLVVRSLYGGTLLSF